MAEAKNPKQIQLKFEVYEKKEGKLGKITEFFVNAEDSTLEDLLVTTLPESWKDFDLSTIKCHSGDFKGKLIGLHQNLQEIPYIQEAMKKKKVPSIIIYQEGLDSPPVSPNNLDVPHKVERTLSNVLRSMIKEIPDPSPLPGGSRASSLITDPINENEEDETFDNDPGVDRKSLAGDSCSGPSSQEDSPQREKRRKIMVLKPSRTFEDRSISVGVLESETTQKFSSSLFTSHRPRSRNLIAFRSMNKIMSDKARTLNYRKAESVISPNHASSMKKRESMFNLSSPISPTRTGGESMPQLNITGPLMEDKTYDWKKKKESSTRVTTRKKTRYTPTREVQMPAASYAESEMHTITVQPEEASSFEVPCREFETIGKFREKVRSKLRRSSCVLSTQKGVEYSLTYRIDGVVYELFNDCQFLYQTALYKRYQQVKETERPPLVVNVNLKENNLELPTLLRFSKLTGVLLDEEILLLDNVDTCKLHTIDKNDKTAVKWARRTLHSYVDEVVLERDPISYAFSMELEMGETPMLLALKIPIDNKIEITFHYKTVFSLHRRVKVNQYASSVLRDVFPCVHSCGLVEDDIDKYTLQFTGELSYLDGDNELIAFRDIRRCILKNEPINLSITKKPTIEDDIIQSLHWVPIDPFSGDPPLHTDISKERQSESEHEILAVSMWDQSAEFGLQIVQVENLPLPVTKEAKKLLIVVEATLYHANQVLKKQTHTKPKQLSSFGTVEWMEMIMFDLDIRNLPKAAKIMIVVKESARKESNSGSTKKKSSVNILYWGLIPVFDHRGILQSGVYSLNLWKGPMQNSKVEQTTGPSFKLNPCAPCVSNPDSQSVKVTVQFSRNTHPVFFPSSAPETCSFLLHKEESSTVRRQFLKLLSCYAEGKLPMSTFPSYIARTDWAKLSQVIEVYALLQQVVEADQHLPVETAMKLLDGEFADEKVRSFAVKVLENLHDEELEDFLLQLTQALKFEPSHDSALARFLLKRALTNKRIGHFFFWYLRCELYNPMYIPRFAVLLEAYLKGCGESMLKRFENQVSMQQQLEEIGRQVDERGGNDGAKMQSLLQELLHQRGINQCELTPVYNPRLRLGQLHPSKCKIMTSKKKPQWLEMRNVDPTALRPTPTKLILKIGDDLRQDVIVLRMLSLFEKLWEREGLPDLHLIPYGCMATGPNTGFIEVVKNAKTIADVSGINDNKKLYEWIRSHQKNEFGEEDPEMLKEAVKKFTYSLAGYTVATYVLGIGDRHNDNIMITTSGNLFHIDFGHFLGNIKYFLGIKREWSPFVLTPDFVYVMGGETSETFATYKNLCCRAFLCLRRHDEIIFNLFSLMRSTGIPELACVEDANYIRDALMVNMPEHEAEQKFKQLIKKCLDMQWTVQMMWWIHLRRTGTGSS